MNQALTPDVKPTPAHAIGEATRFRWRDEWASGATIAGALFAAYSSVVTATYGFADDYPNLMSAGTGSGDLFLGTLTTGRPLSGSIQQLGMWWANDVGSLRWLRMVGLLGIFVLGLVLYRVLRHGGMSRLAATIVASVAMVMPAYQIAAVWSILFPVAFGGALGMLGGYIAVSRGNHPAWIRSLGAAVLLFLALAFYQPIAMLYWVGGAIVIFGRSSDLWSQFRLTLRLSAIGLVAAIGHYLMLGLLTGYSGADVNSRIAIVTDIPGKISWFLREVIGRAFDPLSLRPRVATVIAVAVIAFVGLVMRSSGGMPARIGSAFLFLAFLPAAFAPSLVISENWPSYRSAMAVQVMAVVIVAFAIQGLMTRFGNIRGRALQIGSLVGVFTLLVGFANWRVTTFMTQPQEVEYRLARQAILSAPVLDGEVLYLVPAFWYDSLAPGVTLDEFGIPSTAFSWVPVPLATVEFVEEGRAVPTITLISEADIATLPSDADVIVFSNVLDKGDWDIEIPAP